ncbi:hypothetical protein E2320_021931 [Naja naja]|nr:hypothetical protein E2320_021931 [Naja naja]
MPLCSFFPLPSTGFGRELLGENRVLISPDVLNKRKEFDGRPRATEDSGDRTGGGSQHPAEDQQESLRFLQHYHHLSQIEQPLNSG